MNTRSSTVEGHETQTFNAGQTVSVTAKGRSESIVDNETKSVVGYSDSSYTSNVVINTDATVSTLAASRIMYEAPDIIFGQVIDANGTASAVPQVPFDIKKTQGTILSPAGSKITPAEYLAAASTPAIGMATRVTYKKGVVTHIQGIDKVTVDNNQVVDIKGNVARNIAGNLTEEVLGAVSFYSPLLIKIKSDVNVEIDAPFLASNVKGTQVSFTGVSGGFTGVSGGLTGLSVSHNVLDHSTKNVDLSDADIRIRLKNKIEVAKSNIKTHFNNLFIIG